MNSALSSEEALKEKAARERRANYALACLQGFLSSGRKAAVIEGNLLSLEEAAIYHADRLIKLLDEENK